VHDESQRDAMVVIGATPRQVIEATTEPPGQIDPLEEFLKNDDSSERSQPLIFEPELRYAAR
jgi:hypothetical protein